MTYTYPETIVPEGSPGATTGKIAAWEALGKRLNRDDVFVPVVTNGTDQTGLILDVMDDVPPGTVLRFPRGPITVSPFTVSKCLHLRGAGPFSTRFIPLAATTSPLITFDQTIDSGFGIFDNYGPSISDLAIYRNGHMTGPCLSLTANSEWMQVRNVLCSGGTIGILQRAPNAMIENCKGWDCSDAMIDVADSGMELHLRHVVCSANVTNLNSYIRVALTAANGGALYMDDVSGNAAPGISVTNGMTIISSALVDANVFGEKVILDNVIGGGPVVTLTNVRNVKLANGWLNGTNGCVLMSGCAHPKFHLNDMFGGTHTYEFTGAATVGFQSTDNTCHTGPHYKVGASNKPTDIMVDDNCVNATSIAQVTNDVAWFENAARRTWGARRFQSTVRRREAGTAPPRGYATLVNGIVTVPHTGVTAVSRVMLSRERLNGTAGEVHTSVDENVVGTSFKIRSDSATDNGGVYWEFLGDPD